MDWALAIDRNREALARIIAALFAMAGLAEGGVVRFDRGIAVLPRHVYLAVLNVLRPAESAVRRLVIIAARALVSAARERKPFFSLIRSSVSRLAPRNFLPDQCRASVFPAFSIRFSSNSEFHRPTTLSAPRI